MPQADVERNVTVKDGKLYLLSTLGVGCDWARLVLTVRIRNTLELTVRITNTLLYITHGRKIQGVEAKRF